MTRTLFIGMDGATFTILDDLIQDVPGRGVVMPFLKGLIENGVRAKLRSTANPLTPPAWVSLMTGRSPGHHGVFDFLRAEERGEEVYFTLSDARDIRTETIWSIASRQERSVVSLNFPITAPPRPVRGSLVPGFVPWKHLRRNSLPAGLFDRLKGIDGFNPRELAWDFEQEKLAMEELGPQEVEQWVRYHLVREDQWFFIAEKLLREDRPDLMAVMFDGTDKIQHQAWAYIDPRMPADDSPQAAGIRDACYEYFRKLDGYVRRLVALAPEAQVYIASDHGFTVSTEIVRINAYLHQKGYLAWRTADDSETSRRRDRSWFANLDWHKTLAYCRTPSSNGVWIRVSNRPGETGVPRAEYEAFRQRLIGDLEALRDPATGERIIRAIHCREDVFPGPAMSDAPDLSLELRDYGFVSISNVEPVVEARGQPAGTHHPDGVFIASGPGIRRGETAERRRIMDVAATLLYSLGLSVPRDFEGVVPETFFTDEHLGKHGVRIGAATLPVAQFEAPGGQIADDEKDKIIEQLRMLGYME